VKSCTVSEKAGRYYVSVPFEEEPSPETYINWNLGSKFLGSLSENQKLHSDGIGIDIGIKEFATVSNDQPFGNINKGKRIRKLERKLKREQRSLSRKILNKKRGETATETRTNFDKNILRVQKLHQRLSNIRTEYVKSVVNTLVKTKPEFITIENANSSG
jgi:putative transposase